MTMREYRKERYEKLKSQGLCVVCGDPAVTGKTRCEFCAGKDRYKSKIRRDQMTPQEKERKKEYLKKWIERNPEKMAVYESRKSEYNRRYRNGYEL